MSEFEDQRAHPREIVKRRGALIDSASGQSYRCTIFDISEGGAQLEIEAPNLAEGALALLDPDGGSTYDVRVVWKAGDRMGVAFLSSAEIP